MATAREQAKKALNDYLVEDPTGVENFADVVSDVWEEYIREIKSAAESCRYAAPELVDFHLSRIDGAVKEALGE